MAAKRKRSSVAAAPLDAENVPPPSMPKNTSLPSPDMPKPLSKRTSKAAKAVVVKTEPEPDSPLSEPPEIDEPAPKPKRAKKAAADAAAAAPTGAPVMPAKQKEDVDALRDPEADVDEEPDEQEVKDALARPPPVNSSYLPLPWKGRLGYACLNTYLRYSNPPVFSSRTCRIASILEHRHPLADPTQPEHATKNRPDRSKPADVALGRKYVEDICLANVRDIAKMVRWNEKYGIRFMRLSSEMFPFASHAEYGYKLADFAAHDLAEAGKVIAQYGHRVTTHPGQFTQLGSPRKPVTDNAIRDLVYHAELLSLLKLPPQLDRDAVMILHMGGVFGDKEATLNRFREVYATLPQDVKNRLVLENDDVSWSMHELLPICEELNIPFVLDFHHHNIIFDSTQIREGTADVVNFFPRIKATWDRKGITPKMHYSEPCPGAITGRQRRKHRPRVATLPPCPDTMDLMIEAKDKEQAVFELMRTFKLPGHEKIGDIIPYARGDDNKLTQQAMDKNARQLASKKAKAAKKGADLSDEDDDISAALTASLIADEEVGMGGPDGRVYWPPGMEEWLRPKKREVKPKAPGASPATPAVRKPVIIKPEPIEQDTDSDPEATPATKKAKLLLKQRAAIAAAAAKVKAEPVEEESPVKTKKAPAAGRGRKKKEVMTPSSSSEGEEEEEEEPVPAPSKRGKRASANRRTSGRAKKGVSYAEEENEVEEMDVS